MEPSLNAAKSKQRAVGILVLLISIVVLAATWNLPEEESTSEKYTGSGFPKAA